jgi:hypothetical protein
MSSQRPKDIVELNGYIPRTLKREFKLACTAIDRTMSEVLTELVEKWLEEQKKKK